MKAIKEISEGYEEIKGKLVKTKTASYLIYKNGKEPDYGKEDQAIVHKNKKGIWVFSDNNQHCMDYTSKQLMDIAMFMKKLERKKK